MDLRFTLIWKLGDTFGSAANEYGYGWTIGSKSLKIIIMDRVGFEPTTTYVSFA